MFMCVSIILATCKYKRLHFRLTVLGLYTCAYTTHNRISKDIIFDESCVFYKCIDNSPTDKEFTALPHRIENLHPEPVAVVKKIKFAEYEQHNTDVLPTPAELPVLPSPSLHMYDLLEYKDL